MVTVIRMLDVEDSQRKDGKRLAPESPVEVTVLW